MNETESLLSLVAQTLFDKKGKNILALDVREISDFTDYVILCEGNVTRHVQALYRELVDVLKQKNIVSLYQDGEKEGDWIVIDFGGLIVHLMIPEMREKYRLEDLYRKSQLVDVEIDVQQRGETFG